MKTKDSIQMKIRFHIALREDFSENTLYNEEEGEIALVAF